MKDGTAAYVDCFRDGKLIRTYDFLCPVGQVPTARTPDEVLIQEAKNNLSNERLANPPFTSITFKVRR